MNTNLKTTLKSSKNAKAYFQALIAKQKANEKFNDLDLVQLISYHPTKPISAENLDYLVMRLNEFNTLTLTYKAKDQSEEDDISWNKCITAMFSRANKGK